MTSPLYREGWIAIRVSPIHRKDAAPCDSWSFSARRDADQLHGILLCRFQGHGPDTILVPELPSVVVKGRRLVRGTVLR
jgi:hypothetical protein